MNVTRREHILLALKRDLATLAKDPPDRELYEYRVEAYRAQLNADLTTELLSASIENGE